MKKIYALLLLTAFVLTFTACHKDDEHDEKPTENVKSSEDDESKTSDDNNTNSSDDNNPAPTNEGGRVSITSSYSAILGEKFTLYNNATNDGCTWTSSDNNILYVESNTFSYRSNFYAVGIGTATITATTKNGNQSKCRVTVKNLSYSGTNNGHAYVDLGLTVKWATMNVGASSPFEAGGYYAWGETTTKMSYNSSTYKWNSGYSKDVLDLNDDAARQNWGGTWRMPTSVEYKELINNCTWKSIEWYDSRLKGYIVISKTNRNFIFLPYAGKRVNSNINEISSTGYYWASNKESWTDYLSLSSEKVYSSSHTEEGFSVRPVCP